jgi:MFS transporter, MHS family, proline/betaine transporter
MAEASVLAAPNAHPAERSRQAIWAAAIGNLLEWYDFGVYAYLASLIATKFFPSSNATASLLAAFAAYGVGFLARPLGGIVIGPPRRHPRPKNGARAHHLPDGVRHRGDRPLAIL